MQPNKEIKNKFCTAPFVNLELKNPNVWSGISSLVCCYTPHKPLGDYDGTNLYDVWNSKNAQELRQGILDGSFSACDLDKCQIIHDLPTIKQVQDTSYYYKQVIQHNITVLMRGPEEIQDSYDLSCNLTCPSCRTEKIMDKDPEKIRQQKERLHRIIRTPGLKRFVITGSGDAFGSKAYREFLEELDGNKFNKIKLEIRTNGVLLTKKQWNKLARIHNNIEILVISVDAATEKTYNIVRRGGNWTLLLKNLRYLKTLDINTRLDIVVQQHNYKELPKIVKLAERYNFNNINFTLLTNWGTFTEKQLAHLQVWKPEHPEYNNFIKVLKKMKTIEYSGANSDVDDMIASI